MAPSAASPPSPTDLECGLAPPASPDRRQLERDLVLAFDSRELRRHEAWCLVETAWLDAWMSYVLGGDAQRPGPLSNDALFDRHEYRVRDNLQQTRDYRGVNPQVYALYTELYGDGGAKPIVRWTLDIYAVPVMVDDVTEMLHAPRLKARALVTELNEQLETREKGLKRSLETREEKESWTYRCLCRCEFLVPCLYRLLGGGPTYKKEEQSSWSSYLCCCARRKKKRRSKKKSKKAKRSREEDDSEESETSSDEETHGLLG
ncbi:unnamed protein product [Phytophthora lilii]|uniref:Unnamed protein product n=1 Tax=Phytophthora lilii TaxID=2077276 RepID=A0A9W6TC83_9STRA|nr:unnamed protein product [Phytophthora lilii]